MSCTKWGFEKDYGHKTMPNKWSSSAGYALYDPDPLTKKSFRPAEIPFYRETLAPLTTSYVERAVDETFNMSSYGCHRELSWDTSLRSPRNPFPGSPGRETKYIQQPSPAPTPSGFTLAKAFRSTSSSSPRSPLTPRSGSVPMAAANRRRAICTPDPTGLRSAAGSVIGGRPMSMGVDGHFRTTESVLGSAMLEDCGGPRIVRHPAKK
mmetsp:Transcript_60951/g.157158  ORF Transcript_60951/g.157158 Transcript_60951/m.157158 type:complete len:208 (+) Transcript_60951:110-733(+)